MQLYLIVVIKLLWCFSIQAHPRLTFDEFFDSTAFQSVSLSPNGRYVLVLSQRPVWDSNSFENSLWLYETRGRRKQLITKHLSGTIIPKWSPTGDWFMYSIIDKATTNSTDEFHRFKHLSSTHFENEQQIHFYSVTSDESLSIEIGNEPPSALAWSDCDCSVFFAAKTSRSAEDEDRVYAKEWKDVIEYRRRRPSDGSTIYRVDISKKHRRVSFKIHPIKKLNFTVIELLYVPSEHKIVCTSTTFVMEDLSGVDIYSIDLHDTSLYDKVSFKIHPIKKLNFTVIELLYVPSEHKIVCTSTTFVMEDLSGVDIYSIDLHDTSLLTRLTHNDELEQNLKLSNNGKYVFFQTFSTGSTTGEVRLRQPRLNSIDLTSGQIEEWGGAFGGAVRDYAIRSEGGVFILGQLGINIHVYTQQSSSKYSILQRGWNGTYRSISSSSSKRYSSLVFLHSCFEQPEEVYFIDHVDDLLSARPITNENQWLTKRNLPRAKSYKWVSNDDDRTIEGILHYPPGKFEHKNLPLLVLIHGGPTDASLNMLLPNWYSWAPLAATEGWLVLEPNYRGSTGYGDQFLNEITLQWLSQPGKDILAGVDHLIKDGTADPSRLSLGGYSYGGYLTNWLITQTTRFNAALSGAGPLEHISMWGTTDWPAFIIPLFGGFPWHIPEIYEKESIMYKLDRVYTPTHIVTGANDVRVPPDQSFILERSLIYLEVPVKLIVLPTEGHALINNPWHGKIKVREELKWLKKYGHVSRVRATN